MSGSIVVHHDTAKLYQASSSGKLVNYAVNLKW